MSSLDITGMAVSGGLDKETVRRVVMASRANIRLCHERSLAMASQNQKVEGRLVFFWRIAADGPVSESKIKMSATKSDLLDQCVLNVIKQLVFPRAQNGMATTVSYPFQFDAGSQGN